MESPVAACESEEQQQAHKLSRGLRLLFASRFPKTRESGIGNHLLSLAGALERRGHHVDILWAEDFPSGTQGPRWSRLAFPRQLANEIERRTALRHYDAVNLHEPSGMIYAWRRARRPQSLPPLVITSHGVEQRAWEMQPVWERPRLSSRMLFPLTQLTQSNYSLRHADLVACLSTEDASYLQDQLRVQPEKIRILNNGVDPALLDVTWQTSEQPGLLFIGNWIKRKGTRELVAAFHSLRQAHPRLRLIIAGYGLPAEAVLRDFAPADRASVEVLPRIPRSSLPVLLARDQIFVLPSHFEGMPLSLLEAMAAALPCVTTNTCGMRDLLQHDISGLFVATGDATELTSAIESLLASADKRRQLGLAAQQRARGMTWDLAAQAWEKVFFEVSKKRMPSTLSISKQYDQWHNEVGARDDLERDLDNPWHRFARQHTGSIAGARVLEAACGRGQLCAWLTSQGARVVGLDLSSAALRIAASRMNGGGPAALICGDVERIPCADESFDLVISCETLEHVPNPQACLKELGRVLRPGGRLLMTTENYLNIWGLYRLYKSRRAQIFNSGDASQPIENWMFSPQMAAWIRKAGFRILKTDGEQHHLYLLPRTNPSETETHFLSRNPFFRRLLRYFGRRFYVVAEADHI